MKRAMKRGLLFSKRKGIASERSIPEVEQDLNPSMQPFWKHAMKRSSETNAKESRTVRCGQWLSGFGKSTFINAYAGKACAKTGNKPGVTKGKQWIRLNKGLELLDTPGILWPKFEDQSVGMRLAMIGSIKDEILNTDELALNLIRFLMEYYPGRLTERYGCEETAQEALTVYEEIARRRGCIKKGQELDYTKTGMLLLDDFRSGKLGRITLELPKGETEEQ